jgi:subtilase family serine protease
MKRMTGGKRGLRRAATLAASAASVLLVTACGAVHVHFGSNASSVPAASATSSGYLAYAECMRAHGIPGFPTPSSSGNARSSVHLTGGPGSPAARAIAACEHLQPASGTGVSVAAPAPSGLPTDCLAARPATCDTPRQLLVAYGIQPLLDRGITGRGQTIVLLEFPPQAAGAAGAAAGGQVPAATDIRQDLAQFDRRFGLPAARLQVVNTLAHAASPWQASGEEAEDTEIVHAVAPYAAIREVLIPSPYTGNTGTVSAAAVAALRLGLTQGGVVEFSGGAGEQCFTTAGAAQWNAALQAAQRDRVTVVVSMGDSGAATTPCPSAGAGSAPVKGVDLPGSDPLALAVGGTTLRASGATGSYVSETGWNILPQPGEPRATGGGFSQLFPRPAYQDGVAGIGGARGTPDVAADADPDTGMALTLSGGGQGNILIGAGGDSAAAPLWAAVIALADQYAGRDLGFVNPAIYQIGRGASYHQAFHDVTTGSNTVTQAARAITGYRAAPGWDPVTGWGSPDAQVLVPLLARYVST